MPEFFDRRYGVDSFSLFLLAVSAFILGIHYMWIVSLVLIVAVVVRAFSRDTVARTGERRRFSRFAHSVGYGFYRVGKWLYTLFRPVVLGIKNAIQRAAQKRKQVLFSCPYCEAKLRLPRGRGKLAVTCPVCHQSFIKTT
ncbi:MAG TPA: hypothetical protein DEP42_06535 [Ruminococcaceae bacterium]|nr:hypothetical protein [Oscillospiraceae bacterium]